MNAPIPSSIRYRVNPGDVPASKAARRLGLTPAEFAAKLPELMARGFPVTDPTTGLYDLDAIDLWRRSRNPRLYGLTALPEPAQPLKASGMGERFNEAKKRSGNGAAA